MAQEVLDRPLGDPVQDLGALVVDVADAGDVIAVDDVEVEKDALLLG